MDYQLKLLSYSPISVGNEIYAYPIKLCEIRDVGEQYYNQCLSLILRDKSDMKIQDDVTMLEINGALCLGDVTYRAMFTSALSFFVKEDINLHDEGYFYLGDKINNKIITNEIFEQLVSVIRRQNFIADNPQRKPNPANSKAQELIDKMNKIKQQINEKNKDDSFSLYDVISIVSVHSANYGFFNVWDLTIFQLYTIFMRLIKKDDYDSKFSLLLQGASVDSSDLNHWTTKI